MRKSARWTPIHFHPAPRSLGVQRVDLDSQFACNGQILARVLLEMPFTLSTGSMSAVVRKEAAHDEGAFGVAQPRGL
jgi:hypothetical protein